MCGFAGEIVFAAPADLKLVCEMAALLRDRGPDEEGSFLSADRRCAVGFRRLAVIDIAASHQPMTSPDGAVALALNGEIYNFRQLRAELTRQGVNFKTAGDTEVVLQMYLRDGAAMLARLEGMFAIAIYDGRNPGANPPAAAGRLILARPAWRKTALVFQ